MAIVFDTKAELEAFCEAFELRSITQERPIRKAPRKFTRLERMVDMPQPTVSKLENPHPFQVVPTVQSVDVDTSPLPESAEALPAILASAS